MINSCNGLMTCVRNVPKLQMKLNRQSPDSKLNTQELFLLCLVCEKIYYVSLVIDII